MNLYKNSLQMTIVYRKGWVESNTKMRSMLGNIDDFVIIFLMTPAS